MDKLDKERREIEARLGRELDAEDERIRGVIRGIRNVLHRFGYLHRGYPTEKADMLAAVFDTDGLILCEIVDRGLLDRLPPEDLAEVFSWFSFDREYRYGNRFVLPDRLVLARRRIEDIERSVLGEERAEGLFISEGHNPNFYGAARAWCLGATMADIGEAMELSEGDLVVTFNKTIDLLRQVRDMLADVDPARALIRTLADAERMLKRDIVEQSLLLGFAPIELPDLPETERDLEPRPTRRRRAPRSSSGTSGEETVAAATANLEPEPGAAKPRRSRAKAAAAADPIPELPPVEKPKRTPRRATAAQSETAVLETDAVAPPVETTATGTASPAATAARTRRRTRATSDDVPANGSPVAEAPKTPRKRTRKTPIPPDAVE